MKFNEAKAHAVALFNSAEFKERVNEEDATMLRQLATLQEINRNGFITVNSQAGAKAKGKHHESGKAYENIERAYLMGFMLETKAPEFIKNMGLKTDKNAVFVPVCSDDINLPSALDIPLTITKSAGTTKVDTHFSSALPKSAFDSFKKQVKLGKSEKVVFIFCWDSEWGRKGLFKDVLRILRSLT
jgi:hypothetical protein